MKFLNEHIKNNTFKQVYLIYGEETYLVYQYRDRLKQAYNCGYAAVFCGEKAYSSAGQRIFQKFYGRAG